MQWIYSKHSIFVESGAAPGGIYSSLEEALAVLEDRKQGEVALLIHITRHIKFYNTDRTTWKLTSQDINKIPKELKTERDCSHKHFHVLESVLQNLICLLVIFAD